MSETYFSKLDPHEKESRLSQLGVSKGKVTVWSKGNKTKHYFNVLEFDKERQNLILDSKESIFAKGENLLCSFELRGMSFFAEVVSSLSGVGNFLLVVNGLLYKSEKRSSFRLLTYPIYDVYAEFILGETYEGGKVVNLKSRTSQTALFKDFLKLLEKEEEAKKDVTKIGKFRVQDLSATGLSLQLGELEALQFQKDMIFNDVKLIFSDEVIVVPEVKTMYVIDLISGDKKQKKYKIGLHFPNNPTTIDEMLGKKINKLLRDIDFNKDFENFTK